MEFVIAILAGVLCIEVYAWLPQLSKWLLERAVCRVCSDDRERCREEWNAGLDALPNTIVKLIHVFSIFISGTADKINANFFEAKCDEIDNTLEDLASRHQRYVDQLGSIQIERARLRGKVEYAMKDALSSFKAREWPNGNPDPQLANLFQRAVSAFETFGQTLCGATDQASDLLDVSIDKVTSRVDRFGCLLRMASEKRYQVTELSHKTNLSSDVLATLLRSLTDDLGVIRNTLEDNEWGDDVSKREYEKIWTAIKSVCSDPCLRPPVGPMS